MRRWLILLLLPWLTLASVSAATSQKIGMPGVASLPRAQLFGHSYIKISDWARMAGFEAIADKESVRVTSKWASMRFEADSQKAEINGVQVWLSYPAAKQKGAFFVSGLDFQYLVHPLLWPVRGSKTGKITRICLDPGHGGKDPGNQNGPYLEKNLVLSLSDELKRQLTDAGLKVSQTRKSDRFIELPVRPEIATTLGADLLISLHFNAAAGAGREVQGAEVYCLTPPGAPSSNAHGEGASSGAMPGNRFNNQNVLFAYEVQKSLVRNLGAEDRGLHRARFAVLKTAAMPAILVEGGFLSNPEECKRIADPVWRAKLARAIVDGVLAYKRFAERPTR